MNAEDTTRSFTFTTTEAVSLTVIAHEADVEIHHDAPVGEVTIDVTADEPSYLDEAIKAEEKKGHIELTVPPLLTQGKGRGFALQIGRTSLSFGHTATVTAELHVPRGVPVEVDGKSGDVTVHGSPGSARIRTASGDVTMERCAGGEIRTGSGDVSLDAAEGTLTVQTGSGEVRIDDASGSVQLTSGSGNIEVKRLSSGSLVARTGSADITIGALRGIPLWQDVSTTTGDLTVEVTPRGEPVEGQPHLEVRASSGSGDVTLRDA